MAPSIPTLSKVEKLAIASEIAHFRTVPLAKATLDDHAFKPIYISRALTPDGLGHTLMADTWNTPATIAHLLSLYRTSSSRNSDVRAEVRRFYDFGSGLNAHSGLLHGGVLSCILDSTMSNMAGLAARELPTEAKSVMIFTVQLNVKYEKPVKTPAAVMVKAWIKSIDEKGKKFWVEACVVSGESGEVSHAKAEGLWLRSSTEKL